MLTSSLPYVRQSGATNTSAEVIIDGTRNEVRYFQIAVNASTESTIVSASVDTQYQIYGFWLGGATGTMGTDFTTVLFRDGTAGSSLVGTITVAAGHVNVVPPSQFPVGSLGTTNTLLSCDVGTGINVRGGVWIAVVR